MSGGILESLRTNAQNPFVGGGEAAGSAGAAASAASSTTEGGTAELVFTSFSSESLIIEKAALG
jgi:hypothetical protein